jgi:hypothetical protein
VTRLLLFLVAAAALPGTSRAAAPARDPLAEIAARAAERGVPEAPLSAPVREARERGLPPEPVADKVLEGLAKGVPPERIGQVASALVARLGEADLLLGEAVRQGLAPPRDRSQALLDLAHAIGAGIDRGSVEALAAAARGRDGRADGVVASALALGALARRGVPVADALPLGRALARAPATAADVAPAFDAWRAQGGEDARTFLAEAERRVLEGHAPGARDRQGHDERGRGRDRDHERARDRSEERGRMHGEPARGAEHRHP